MFFAIKINKLKLLRKLSPVLCAALLFGLSVSNASAAGVAAKCYDQLGGSLYTCSSPDKASGIFEPGHCYIYSNVNGSNGWTENKGCTLSVFSQLPDCTSTNVADCSSSPIPATIDPASPECQTTPDKQPKGCITSGCKAGQNDCGLTVYFNNFIKFLAVAVGVACAIGMIYGGIEYSMSGGNPQKVQSGKKHITRAIIALVAFAFFYAFLEYLVPGGFLNG